MGRGALETAPGISHQTMIMAGFDPDAVLAAESASGVVTDIRHALGVDDPRIENFSHDQIKQATRYCCGAMTFDGAPHIKPDHLPVLDWSPGGADRMTRAAHPLLDGLDQNATLTTVNPGIRRGRFVVYDGGVTKDRPTEDRPANTNVP